MKITLKFLLVCIGLGSILFFNSCKKDDVDKVIEFIVETTSPINEGSTVEVTFSVPEKLIKEGEIKFQINSTSSATYGASQDYVIEGATQDGNIFTLKIPTNSSSTKLTLKALKDSKIESDETIILDIISSSSNLRTSQQSSVQIFIKDKTIALLFDKVSDTIYEGYKRKKITFHTSSPILENTSFQLLFDQSQSTANIGTDFTTTPAISGGTITIPASVGNTEFSFLLSSHLDQLLESNEIIKVLFTNLSIGYASDESATITILNNTLANGLIGEFLFDGSAADTSPNQNHGTVVGPVGGMDHINSGQFAYSFDGLNDYVSIPHSSALNLESSNFTISVWASVSIPQATPSNGIFDIVRKWTGNAEGYPFSISYLNENASFQANTFIGARYDGSSCGNGPLIFSNTLFDENYYHIVLIKEGSLMKLFINNVKVSEVNDTTSCSQVNTSHVTVGCRGQLVRFFKGKIDDLRFYNRALSANEIDILFKI